MRQPYRSRHCARRCGCVGAADGIKLFAVSVGADADTALMDEIAALGGGTHFHAEGSIEQYSAQLDAIFEEIGGRQPVELVE